MAGYTEIGSAIYDQSEYKGDIQFETQIDEDFKVPEKYMNDWIYTEKYKEKSAKDKEFSSSRLHEPNRHGPKNAQDEDMNGTYLDPEFKLSQSTVDIYKLKIKEKNMSKAEFRVTERDLYEYNAYIKSRSKEVPRLMQYFKSPKEYEDYMHEYQQDNINVTNDPAIMGNEKTFSNGADALVALDSFKLIEQELRKIVNISKRSNEFKVRFTDKDAKKFLSELADKINYQFNDKNFSFVEKTFAKKVTKVILRVGTYDLELNMDEGICTVLDEDINFRFDAAKPFDKMVKELTDNLKKNGLKKFSAVKQFADAEVKDITVIGYKTTTTTEPFKKIYKATTNKKAIEMAQSENKGLSKLRAFGPDGSKSRDAYWKEVSTETIDLDFFSESNEQKVIVTTTDPDRLCSILNAIKEHGNVGHCLDVAVDYNDEKQEVFQWDGDGSCRISDITVEGAEQKVFAESACDYYVVIHQNGVVDSWFGPYFHNEAEKVEDKITDELESGFTVGIWILDTLLNKLNKQRKGNYTADQINSHAEKRTFSNGADSISKVKIEDDKFSSTKQFDAIPNDHSDQELGNNSFIVVKVSPTTGEYFYYDVVSEVHPWWDVVHKTHVDQNVSKLVDKKFVVTKCTKEVTLNEANDYIQKMTKKSGIKSYSKDGACPESGCVQKKPNGSWGVISNKTGEFWDADYDSEDSAKNALAAYHAQKHFSNAIINLRPETDGLEDIDLTLGDVIGTLLFSVTYTHLFHLATEHYPAHIALNEYYDAMPDLVDALAEHYLGNVEDPTLACKIVPESGCPIEYLERVHQFIVKFRSNEPENGEYGSQLDAIMDQLSSTLYKLKRLSSGKKVFSTKTFSDKKYEVIILPMIDEDTDEKDYDYDIIYGTEDQLSDKFNRCIEVWKNSDKTDHGVYHARPLSKGGKFDDEQSAREWAEDWIRNNK